MRSAGNFHPEWGYLAPAPSFMRTVRIALVATAIGATAGAAVVVSLVERPSADAGDSSIATHALVTSVQPAGPRTQQTQTASLPPLSPAPAALAQHPAPAAAQPGIANASPPPAAASAPNASAKVASAAPAATTTVTPIPTPAALASIAAPVQAQPPQAVAPPPAEAALPATPEEAAAPDGAPAKKADTKKHHPGRSESARHWSPAGPDVRKRWARNGGIGPLLHLFSSDNSAYPN
jgi:hypothetical protein